MRKLKPNRLIKSVTHWSRTTPFKLFVDDLRSRLSSGNAPTGRIKELFLSSHHYWQQNAGIFEVKFVKETLEVDMTVWGDVFVDGVKKRKQIKFRAGTTVLKRVASIPGDRNSCTMDIGALLFQLQFPNEVGVPILYSTMAGSSDSSTEFSYTNGGYSRWPKIKVFGESCCVAQLVCLLQFGYAPRHPQHQDTKYINHGWECTLTYNHTNRCA